MKTIYATATSLDGYLADEEHALDWLFQFDETAGVADDFEAFVEGVGAIAMGSTTYEWLLEHEDLLAHPDRWPYEVPVWVFSTRDLPAVDGTTIRVVRGDVTPVHEAMVAAAAGRHVWLVGGGDLVGQFHDRGLLDEIVVTVAPVTLGGGAPLLPRRITSTPLRLTGVEQVGDVFATLTYEVPSRSPEA